MMEAFARAFTGIVVAGLTVYSSVANTGARICPSDRVARKLWRAALVAGIPDLKNHHAEDWSKEILQHDSNESAQRAAGEVWVNIADPENDKDVGFAYVLLAVPSSPVHYNVRDAGIGFLIRRLGAHHFDQKTFEVAESLAKTPGWLNRYDAARLLGRFGESPWKDAATRILQGFLTDGTGAEASEAQRELARITGHIPHYAGELCCEIHPLVIAGKQLKCTMR